MMGRWGRISVGEVAVLGPDGTVVRRTGAPVLVREFRPTVAAHVLQVPMGELDAGRDPAWLGWSLNRRPLESEAAGIGGRWNGRPLGEDTMRWILLVGGAFFVLAGALWTLQGLDVLGGSAMSGERTWAVIGPIVAVGGLAAVAAGLRRRR